MLVAHVRSRARAANAASIATEASPDASTVDRFDASVRPASRAARLAWLAYLVPGVAVVAWLCAFNSGLAVTFASPAIAFASAAATLLGCALHVGRRQRGWAVLALGIALLGAGDLIWALMLPDADAAEHVPFAVDVAYLVGYGSLATGLFLLARDRSLGRDLAADIDVGIVGLGLALFTWLLSVEHVVDVPGGRVAAGLVVPVAYGALSLALALALVRMLFQASRSTRSTRLAELGVVAFLASGILYVRAATDGTWTTGSAADAGWLVAYVLWAASSLHPSSAAPAQPPEPGSFSFGRAASLATACLVVPAAIAWSWWCESLRDLPVIAVVSAAVSLLWTARVTVSLRRLRRSLDERQLLEHRLRDQAMRDPLVGLPNRSCFEQRLLELTAADERIAVLYLDLDDFKVINDTFGHAAGDAVLVQAAGRIDGVLRGDDLAARLGGDEFVILLRGVDVAAVHAVAQRLLGALHEPFMLDGRPIHVHGSIGVSLAAAGKDPADIMREADVAMYLAKDQGKGRYQVFEASMHAAVMSRIALRSELEQAIASGEFVLHYQPIVTASLETVFACEALVRWHHPDRGLLLPGEFIDLAEETGLIVPLGRWIVEEACREAVRWAEAAGGGAPAVAVNLSSVQFRHPTFVRDLVAATDRAGIDPARVILELTESTLIDGDDAKSILPELRQLGFRIALDDFGTGYSSLAYLANYPIDLLKIDRAFVAALGTGARDDRLAAAIVNLSRDLRIQVIGEGVETEEQRRLLSDLGCKWIQGWLIAGAMPGHDVEQLLDEWRRSGTIRRARGEDAAA